MKMTKAMHSLDIRFVLFFFSIWSYNTFEIQFFQITCFFTSFIFCITEAFINFGLSEGIFSDWQIKCCDNEKLSQANHNLVGFLTDCLVQHFQILSND